MPVRKIGRGPQECERDAVGAGLTCTGQPGTDEYAKCQTRDSCTDVDDRTSGEVEDGQELVEPSPSPDPVGHGRIDEYRPYDQEPDNGVETYTLGTCPQDQSGGHYGEHHLERGELQCGYRPSGCLFGESSEEQMLQIADYRPVASECQGISDGDPRDAHDGYRSERLRDHRRHALSSQHPPIEEGEPGDHGE